MKRVLISVSDKTGILEFSEELVKLGYEIISTGGTCKILREAGIKVLEISEITNFRECMDGRVKTLHPNIHGGILARRDKHMNELKQLNISPIDMVVVNLYPFKQTILKENASFEEAIENIDIGGPSMLRSASKNHEDVIVLCDPKDYMSVLNQLKEDKNVDKKTRLKLAAKAFSHTAHYDTLISEYLKKFLEFESFPETINFTFEKAYDLRYGENSHQKAAFYKNITNPGISALVQLHGKELSYNNINDVNASIEILGEFDEPTAVAVKHANPCGVASSDNIIDAYKKAHDSDPVSIFGGIVALNRDVCEELAEELSKIFLEVIIAPNFSQNALDILTKKKNLRLLTLNKPLKTEFEIKTVSGDLLIQEKDNSVLCEKPECVTKKIPTAEERDDLIFAFKVVKHVKSNAIVIAKNKQVLGVGAGQTNRIGALEIAVKTAGSKTEGAVMASDAFFPFSDCVSLASQAKISSIIQPGGSLRDNDSIEECNNKNISMAFTKIRHFKH